MTADVAIGAGARLFLRASFALRGDFQRGHARPVYGRSRRRAASCILPSIPPAKPAKRDRAALADFCASRGLDPLKSAAKHHRVALGGTTLRWEQHSEFTTYTWELPSQGGTPFHPGCRVIGGADGGAAAAGAAVGRARSAFAGRATGKICGREIIRPRQSGGGGKFRRPSAVCHRLPGRSGRLRARPGARPRLGPRARRRAGSAHCRIGNLSHAGAARPAGGAAADAVDRAYREAARPKPPKKCAAPAN